MPRTLRAAILAATIGVALPLAALSVCGKLSASGGARLACFRATCFVGAALCLLDAGLIVASLILADHVRISRQAVIVSLIVASAFLLAGLLVLRIAGQVSKICILQPPEGTVPALTDVLRGLLVSLITAGLWFAAIMGLVAVGFLSRIGEGFAIFG